MKPHDYNTTATRMTIDEAGTLQKFYSLTDQLSRTRHVRFTGKLDDVDNIEWHFKYRGHPLSLQYDIYNGVTLMSQDSKDAKAAIKLVVKLKGKTV